MILIWLGIDSGTNFSQVTNKIPVVAGILVPLILVGVIAGIWYYFSPKFLEVGYTPKQPVPFSHKLHAGELGMDCRYCHNTIERSAFAPVPSTQTCMGCHASVRKDSKALAPVRESFETEKPVEWINVHMLPEYAHFDHSAHLSAGVGCVSCHGRIDQMAVVGQVKPLSMGWCIECHRNPTPALRPRDQVTNMTWDPKQAGYDPHNDPHRTAEVNPPLHCSGCHY